MLMNAMNKADNNEQGQPLNTIDIQYACSADWLPEEAEITRWAETALQDQSVESELGVRLVDEEEGKQLNQQWRQGKTATNVLSFPADIELDFEPRLLGDVVICIPVIEREALAQGKTPINHLAHMVIHGTLHLIGYDHIEDKQAEHMEAMEIQLLKSLNIDNPYN